MKVKRGKDRHWRVIKYKDDVGYYAKCKCKFEYRCGDMFNRQQDVTWTLYRYCPNCGARKKWYNPEVQVLSIYRYSNGVWPELGED